MGDEFDEREKAEKLAKYGLPTKQIEELLREAGCEDKWMWKWKGPKKDDPFSQLTEQKIDSEIFWDMDYEKVGDQLKIEHFGIKQSLTEAIKEVKEDHQKMVEIKEAESKNLNVDQIAGMRLLAASC